MIITWLKSLFKYYRLSFFDCDCACYSAPDTTALAAASEKSAQIMADLGQRQLDESKRQYDVNSDIAKPVVQAQLDIMNQTKDQGADYFNYMKTNQRPVETALKDAALAGESPEQAAARAAIVSKMGTLGADQKSDAVTIGGAYDSGAGDLLGGGRKIAKDLTTDVGTIGSDLNRATINLGFGANRDLTRNAGMTSAELNRVGTSLDTRLTAVGTDAGKKLTDIGANLNTDLVGVGTKADSRLQEIGSNTEGKMSGISSGLDTRMAGIGKNLDARTAGISQGLRDYVGKNESDIKDDVGLFTSGNKAIVDKYGNDISFDVNNAVADTRAGQASAIQTAIRQGLRYGMSPSQASSAVGISNAQQLAAAANQTRTSSTDKYRGLVGAGIGMKQKLYDTGAQTMTSAANAETQGAMAGADLEGKGALSAADISKAGVLTNADLSKTGILTSTDLAKTGATSAADFAGKGVATATDLAAQGATARADYAGKGALTAADLMKTGTLTSTALQGQALSDTARMASNAATTRAGIEGSALSDSTNLSIAGTEKATALREAGGQTELGALTAGRSMATQDSATQTAKLMDVAGLYRNLPGASTGAYSVANASGNSAVNNQMAPGQALISGNASGANIIGQGQQLQLNGLGSILNAQTSYANSSNAAMSSGSGGLGGLGSIMGGAASLYAASSKRIKKDKSPVKEGDVLDKVESLPIDEWTYEEGEGDGGTHIGPYAEDMQQRFGDKVAPGGRVIDIVSSLGVNLAATKALAKKVSAMEKRRAT